MPSTFLLNFFLQRTTRSNQNLDASTANGQSQQVNASLSTESQSPSHNTAVRLSMDELRLRRVAALDVPLRQQSSTENAVVSSTSWTDDLYELQQKIDVEVVTRANTFNVDRSDVLSSFKRVIRRNGFSILHKIDVCFVDVDGATEGAIDGGGPTREFLRLLVKEVLSGPLFEGPEDERYMTLNTYGICIKLYCFENF